METQRRYEAATLAEVLAKVQRELGPGASISSAHRIRTGGFMGFFQRERVQVTASIPSTIEEPDDSPESLMELAEIANSNEQRLNKASGADASFKDVFSRAVKDQNVSTQISDNISNNIEDNNIAVATKLSSRAEVEKSNEMGNDPSANHRFNRNSREPSADERMNAIDHAEPAKKARFEPTVSSTEKEKDILKPPPRSSISQQPQQSPYEPIIEALRALGLPDELIPTFSSDLQRDIMHKLQESLPVAQQLTPGRGAIVCLVGSSRLTTDAAEAIAQQYDTDETYCATRSSKRSAVRAGSKQQLNTLETPTDATNAKRSWCRRRQLTIVTIDSTMNPTQTKWAEQMLCALEPIATYAVIEAITKPDDIQIWASKLGGLDGLVLRGIDDTMSPASALAAKIPVIEVDGKPANAAFWSLLLTERIASFARGDD